MIPNFDAQYAAFRAPPFLPHCEDMLMMRPRVLAARARDHCHLAFETSHRSSSRRRGCPDYRRGRAASRSIPAGPIFEQEAPMARTTQLTISLASKPGVLAQLARTLADARV